MSSELRGRSAGLYDYPFRVTVSAAIYQSSVPSLSLLVSMDTGLDLQMECSI
jgi:hypothetical protein